MASNLNVHELHSDNPTETYDLEFWTGYFSLTDLKRDVIIRRINLNYISSKILYVSLYRNGDSTSVKRLLTFPVNNVSKIYNVSLKPNLRATTLSVRVTSSSSLSSATESVIINQIEIETDG